MTNTSVDMLTKLGRAEDSLRRHHHWDRTLEDWVHCLRDEGFSWPQVATALEFATHREAVISAEWLRRRFGDSK